MYSEILKVIDKKQISVKELSELTGIAENTLYHILHSEDNFNKTSFQKVMLIKDALKTPTVIAGGKVYLLSFDDVCALQVLLNKLAN